MVQLLYFKSGKPGSVCPCLLRENCGSITELPVVVDRPDALLLDYDNVIGVVRKLLINLLAVLVLRVAEHLKRVGSDHHRIGGHFLVAVALTDVGEKPRQVISVREAVSYEQDVALSFL